MGAVTMYKDGETVTVLPELADYYKMIGWTDEEPKAKAVTTKKKTAKAESET